MGHCHCSRCRRFTGAAHSTWLAVAPDDFSLAAGDDLIATYGEGRFAERTFCSRCGSSLYARLGQTVYVEAGTLDADPGLRPRLRIMVAHKAAWDEIGDELAQFPEWPPEDWTTI